MRHATIEALNKWLVSSRRKPLVVRGARQVGKTWVVRELAKQTQKKLIEINFEKQRNFFAHFESNDPKKIILNLESTFNTRIDPAHSLLFLDEIQAYPEILAKLRWFYEGMPELPVIAAGSLLEFVLENHTFSMPVGRIEYFFMEPIGFEEFLLAKQETHLLSAIQKMALSDPFISVVHEKANALFREYVMVGGMPEAVVTWVNTQSFEAVNAVQHNLINTYKDDFSKYAGNLSLEYLEDVLTAAPKLLAQKFTYSKINPDARHASIKKAVQLLSKARICHLVHSVHANGIPMGAEKNEKVFKMIMLDVGLVSALLGLRISPLQSLSEIALINEGAIAEQIVGQSLRLLFPDFMDPALYYWSRETPGSNAEIDYLIQQNMNLVPIEVKAGSEGKLRSLHQFMHEKPWKIAVRFYAGNIQVNDIHTKTSKGAAVRYKLISLPFYLLQQLNRILDLEK